MQKLLEIIVLSCLSIVSFNYCGYAIIAWLVTKLSGEKYLPATLVEYPAVSFIVAAFNEEDVIEEKIQNSLDLEYPSAKIEYLFITDGSTDRTNEIISRYPEIRLIYHPERLGKSAALNRVTEIASNPILVFSDANALLNRNALPLITRHYLDGNTGGVAGEKRVLSSRTKDDIMNSEGLYWKYESALKKIDSDFYSIVGAAGELFSVRKQLWNHVAENTILDDFVISMQIAQKGYKIRYEPDAYAMELPSSNLDEERKRKIRIATGGFQAMKKFRGLYRFWSNPRLSFLYISHRVLRWAVSPICLILLLLFNAAIVISYNSTFYECLLILQSGFYLFAFLGFIANKNKRQIPLLSTCYYFTFMNLSSIAGLIRFRKNEKKLSGIWEKAKRQTEIP